MKIRIGGWTRIWIVLCIVCGAIALYDLDNSLDYAQARAKDAYDKEVSWIDTCADLAAKSAAGTLQGLNTQLYQDGCSPPPTTAHAVEVRDQTLRERQSAAYTRASNEFLWPVGFVGAMFVALGWIRSGFRSRRNP